jgi:hypothetical protein
MMSFMFKTNDTDFERLGVAASLASARLVLAGSLVASLACSFASPLVCSSVESVVGLVLGLGVVVVLVLVLVVGLSRFSVPTTSGLNPRPLKASSKLCLVSSLSCLRLVLSIESSILALYSKSVIHKPFTTLPVLIVKSST